MNSLNTQLKLINIIQRIENTEDIDTILLRLLHKVVNSIIRQRRVRNTVSATQQHLERDVRDELPHLAESVPRILVQEAHSDIEGRATPALERVQVSVRVACLLGNVQQVNSADTGSQERLVGVTPGGVHEQTSLVCANGLGEGLGALLDEDLAPALGAGLGDVDLGSVGVEELGHDDLALELGLADLALDAGAVDGDVAEVGEQLLGAVLGADEVEELGRVIDEGRPAVAVDEGGVGEQRGEEGDVGLDAADTEFNQGSQHFAADNLVGRSVACAFYQHAIIMSSQGVSRGYR